MDKRQTTSKVSPKVAKNSLEIESARDELLTNQLLNSTIASPKNHNKLLRYNSRSKNSQLSLESEANLNLGIDQETPNQAQNLRQPPDQDLLSEFDHLNQVKVKYELANNSLTFFDKSNYIQVMFNPMKKDNASQEIITVEIVQPSLSMTEHAEELAEKTEKESDDQIIILPQQAKKWPEVQKQTEIEHNDNKICDLCGFKFNKDENKTDQIPDYQQLKKFMIYDSIVCGTCFLKYYTRHKLLQQTDKRKFYRCFGLKPYQEKKPTFERAKNLKLDDIQQALNVEEQIQAEVVDQFSQNTILGRQVQKKLKQDFQKESQRQNFMMLKQEQNEQFKKKLKSVADEKQAKFVQFAKFQKNPSNPSSTLNYTHKYAKISVWKQEKDTNRYKVTKMIKVIQPVTLNVARNQHLNEEVFLHTTDSNELYYFTHQKGNQADETLTCSKLQLDCTDCFEDPSLCDSHKHFNQMHSFTKKDKIWGLFKYVLMGKESKLNSTAYMQLFQLENEQQILVIKALFKPGQENNWDSLKTPQCSENNSEKFTDNLVFIELNSRAYFVIKDADLLLNFKLAKENMYRLFVVQKNEIAKYQWQAGLDQTSKKLNEPKLEEKFAFQNLTKKKGQLKDFLSKRDTDGIDGTDYLVQGYLLEKEDTIHNVAIIYSQIGVILFELDCNKKEIEKFQQFAQMGDAQFFTENQNKPEEKVYVVGNLEIKVSKSTKYQRANFDMIEISNWNNTNKKSLICNLPQSFEEIFDNDFRLNLPPYYLMPFKFQNDTYQTQMFYQSYQQKELLFLNANVVKQKNQAQIYSDEKIQPQWHSQTVTENFIVNYPILGYKSHLATDNQLFFVNLAVNEPQYCLDISPFKFVQFVQSGMYPERFFENSLDFNTIIFLLVEKESVFYLMCFRLFPWPIKHDQIQQDFKNYFMFYPEIQIFSGSIQSKLYQEVIMEAILLQRPIVGGFEAVIALQMPDQVIFYNLNNSDFEKNNKFENTLKMQMQPGPFEQIYFGDRDKMDNHQISQLTFIEKDKISKQTIYKSNQAQILAFHVGFAPWEHNKKSEQPHYILILDSEKQLKKLWIKGSQQQQDITTLLTVNFQNVPKIQRVISFIKEKDWEQVLLNEKGIIANHRNEKNEVICSTLSTSKLVSRHEYIGFAQDKKLKMLKEKKSLLSENIENYVSSVQDIRGIGKYIYEVKEDQKNYFLISSQMWGKRIDLMRLETQLNLVEDLVLLSNSMIGVKFKRTNQYLLFSQSNFTACGSLPYRKIEKLTIVENDVQYFRVKVQASQVKANEAEIKNEVEYQGYIEDILIFNKDERPKLLLNCIEPERKLDQSYQKNEDNGDNQKSQNTISKNKKTQIAIQQQQKVICYFNFDYSGKKISWSKTFCEGKIKVQQEKIGLTPQCCCGHSVKRLKFILPSQDGEKFDDLAKFVIFTRDYIVLRYGHYVLFAKISKLDQNEIEFNVLNTDSLPFNHNNFVIKQTALIDKQFADIVQDRQNVIQISFDEAAIMWDLDVNKEVTFLTKPSAFSNYQDFVVTGFKTHFKQENEKITRAMFLQQNEDRSLLVSVGSTFIDQVLFRTYTALHLIEVFELLGRKISSRKNKNSSDIDEDTMLTNFNGLSFFQLFSKVPDYLQILENKILERGFNKKLDIDAKGDRIDNIYIRKIYWLFNIPLFVDFIHTDSVQNNLEDINELLKTLQVKRLNILQYVVFKEKNFQMLSLMLRLILISQEFRLSDLVGSIFCFNEIFDMQSESIEVKNFLNDPFLVTPQTEQVKWINWYQEDTLITFGSDFSLLKKEQIEKKVVEQQNDKKFYECRKPSRTTQVEVKILELEWIASTEKLNQFFQYLQAQHDCEKFNNELIKVLIGQQNYRKQLFFRVFLPNLFFIGCKLIYFSRYLPIIQIEGGFLGMPGNRQQLGYRILILIESFITIGLEIYEMAKSFKYSNQGSGLIWNIVQWSSSILSIVIVIEHGSPRYLTFYQITQIASFVIVLQWLLIYQWMRIIPQFSFYVTILPDVLQGISQLIPVFLLCITMIANAFFVLNQMQPEDPESNLNPQIYDKAINISFVDAIIHQYLLGLGDFQLDNYEAHPARVLIYIYFLFATLFTQLIFLNMLIAIVTETYESARLVQYQSYIMETSHLYADKLNFTIAFNKELKDKRYQFIVQPVEESKTDSDVQFVDVLVRKFSKVISAQYLSN